MASFGRPRVLGRIVVMLILILALVVGGLIWFDFLGLIDAKAVFAPAYRLVGIDTAERSLFDPDSPTLLDDERLGKQLATLEAGRQELAALASSLDSREAELQALAEDLADREAALADREKSFNSSLEAFDNRKANVEQNARYLTGMRPADAVEILGSMDDQLVIDVLRMVEDIARREGTDSIVAYWLSLMPSDRAAALQRKMAEKPAALP
ncbi:MAG TPA: flagellar protein FlbB [Spirochaetales bacterium]|nr:flagellar protein FlbB [Spirochaetales bacterium]